MRKISCLLALFAFSLGYTLKTTMLTVDTVTSSEGPGKLKKKRTPTVEIQTTGGKHVRCIAYQCVLRRGTECRLKHAERTHAIDDTANIIFILLLGT
jgi:hypothetical protein